MTNLYIATASREKCSKKEIQTILEKTDPKKWIIAKETGRGGYKHWQIRVKCSGDLFEECSKANLNWHIEKSTEWSDYERKEANFWTSDDTPQNLIDRYGTPKDEQKRVLKLLESTNNREIVLWVDEEGNHGKSWLGRHLWETGKGHYTRFTGKDADSIVKDTCSKMEKNRRPIMVIDIPRSSEWSDKVYEAIEVIKDGLIDDPRYSASTINISGVKVLVTSNSHPYYNALSKDRWICVNEKKITEKAPKRARKRAQTKNKDKGTPQP